MNRTDSIDDVYNSRGTFEIDRDTLSRIPLPSAAGRPRWEGIPHHHIIDILEDTFKEVGWTIANERITVQRNGMHMWANFDIGGNNGDFGLPAGIWPRFTIGNSHDSTFAVRGYVAAVVLKCCNGMTATEGDLTICARRHTAFAIDELPLHFKIAVAKFRLQIKTIKKDIDILREKRVHVETASHIMLQAAQQHAISWRDLESVNREWKEPSEENCGSPQESAWRLMSAFSFINRPKPPGTEQKKNLDAKKLIFHHTGMSLAHDYVEASSNAE